MRRIDDSVGEFMGKVVAIFAIFALTGCNQLAQDKRTLEGANGKTPVRYVICSPGETNCFVAARFKDFDGCESHARWASMLCDSTSIPGKMICEEDKGLQISVTHCTM
jgi:hypothetical protein